MFGLDLKKFAGAILAAGLTVMVIGFIGDILVQPKKQKATPMTAATSPPIAAKEVEIVMSVASLLATADAAAGKKISKKCKSCHDLTEKKKRGIGPPLWDIVQAGKAGNSKFKYSSAMSSIGGKWSYEDLDAFLTSPKGFMQGTKMAFPGVKKAKDRANLIAFLRSLSDAPKPLPQ